MNAATIFNASPARTVMLVLLTLAWVALEGCGSDSSSALPPPKPESEAGVDASDGALPDGPWADATYELSEAAPDVIEQDGPTVCSPKSCANLGAECGSAPDGCGGKVDCGTCASGKHCGGGGLNKCGTNACNPKTCSQVSAECGYASDGCSEAIDCGGCPTPKSCGGGGSLNKCGCTAKTCAQLGAECGTLPDGCEATIDCGSCAAGKLCGGSGPNKCGTTPCNAKTCAQLQASCGFVSDGCSKAIDCGACQGFDQCGGAGTANQCGCSAKSCAQLGASCGEVLGSCGKVQCGNCALPDTCGGGGTQNQCGCVCQLPHATTKCLGGVCSVSGCDPGWANCDGDAASGCETDITSSLSHCGDCGSSCVLAHAVSSCSAGTCTIVSCNAGYADCDGDAATGCEANTLADPMHCGSCGTVCPAQGATAVCNAGVCGVSNCPQGKADCDGVSGNGCEVDTTASSQHCGFCKNSCAFPNATAKCVNSACQIDQCNPGYGNCDGSQANGCETSTAGSTLHCGSCGHACSAGANASVACVSGGCVQVCNGGFGNCDGNDGNGCEADLVHSAQHCGLCTISCQAAHGTAGCANGHCTVTSCVSGWTDCDGTASNGCETSTGASCSSAPNACGQTNSGWIDCSGCNASTPSDPPGYGAACSSSPNACGQTNSGWIDCLGCNASTPPNPAGYGSACSSPPNACGQTGSGTIDCGGCNASTPANPPGYDVCTPSGSQACACMTGVALNEYCYDSQGGFNESTLASGCANLAPVSGVNGCGNACSLPCIDSCTWTCHDGGNAVCWDRGYGPATAGTCTCD
ncbi:MAG: hypothetical protein HY898_23480 [Deltaproteobacteria bacterium]|nr:hypothetical protein [Deltaproteobacteria bacterium]